MMSGQTPILSLRKRAFAAALALLAGGNFSAARAGSLSFRNDTDGPVIVQCLSIVNNRVIQGRPHTLQPGDSCSDLIRTPGNKRILVANAKQPKKLFFQDNIIFLGPDQLFSIQDDSPNAGNNPNNPRGRKPVVTSVKLVPVILALPGQAPGQRATGQPQPPPRIKH
jgi:hypothetical protein